MISAELQRIQQAKADIKTAIEAKGVSVPPDALLSTYPSRIAEIPTGTQSISVKDMGIKFGRSTFTEIPEIFDFAGVADYQSMYEYCKNLLTIKLDLSQATTMRMSCRGCESADGIVLSGGSVKKGLDYYLAFQYFKSAGTVYYELPGDYSDFFTGNSTSEIKEWKRQVIGDVPVKMRVMKDGIWLEGEQNLTVGGVSASYSGKGLYEAVPNITFEEFKAKPSFDVLLDGALIGQALVDDAYEQTFYVGNSSDVYEGRALEPLITFNPNKWFYGEAFGGIRSKPVTDAVTRIKMSSIKGEFIMTYGQDSDSEYDYGYLGGCKAYPGYTTSFKGQNTGLEGELQCRAIVGENDIFEANYKKNYSGSAGEDAFWIKKIEVFKKAPYPAV